MTAKAAASHLGVPLLWLKADAIFSKYVGESEQNVRRALQLADAVAPCVVLIDEVEKLLAGAGGSGDHDSGVTKRVLGTVLTWMQEHTTPVMVLATANNPLGITPELMGRFDETFFVNLPNETERAAIFDIHLRRIGRDPLTFNLAELVRATPGFSGREIERALNEGLYSAFGADTELSTVHVVEAAKKVRPLSKTRREEIAQMRDWAERNARPASVAVEVADTDSVASKLETA
jgi:SpoVK/Ycf46/Vps4 family AAA+-type ATPase